MGVELKGLQLYEWFQEVEGGDTEHPNEKHSQNKGFRNYYGNIKWACRGDHPTA